MRISVGQRLFWAVLLANLAVAATIFWMTHISIRRGVATYLATVQLGYLDTFAARLEQAYIRDRNWNVYARDPLLWQSHVEEAVLARETDRRRPAKGPPPDFPMKGKQERTRSHPSMERYDLSDQISRTMLLDAEGEQIAGQAGRPMDREVRRELKVDGRIIGFIAATVPNRFTEIDRAYDESVRYTYIATGLGCLFLCGVIAWFLRRSFVQPIEKLVSGTRELAAGNYATRINLNRRDELGDLVRDFNGLGDALERHEASRRQWVADTSHELRTPIAILNAQIEAIRDGKQTVTPVIMQSLHGQTQMLGKLVDDLHALARADAGALALRREVLDPLQLLDEVVTAFGPQLHTARMTVDFQVREVPTCGVFADPDRLHQVWTNLIGNSLRYTATGGTVRITHTATARDLTIRVEDSEPGVPAVDLPHLFDRFYRVDRSRNRHSGGSGLGLAICKSIVEAHQGHIRAAPSLLGGLLIEVTWPRTTRQT